MKTRHTDFFFAEIEATTLLTVSSEVSSVVFRDEDSIKNVAKDQVGLQFSIFDEVKKAIDAVLPRQWLTDAVSWAFSERQIGVMVSFRLFLLSEAVRVKPFGVWIMVGVMVQPYTVDKDLNSFRNYVVCAGNGVVFIGFSLKERHRWVEPKSF